VRAVRYDRHGGVDVLRVEEVDIPAAGAGEVVVAVRAAGTNPGEAAVREGVFAQRWPSTFPSGQGSDLAGVVHEVGAGVAGWAVGDEVLGWVDTRGAQAEYALVPAEHLVRKPASVPWEVAGALFIAGATAYAAVRAIALRPGETVAVSAAAGGVGSVTVQLLKARGANVVGIASEPNHAWLRSVGVTPVAYGDDPGGLADRLAAAAPGGIDAFIDLFGPQYVDLAVALGIPRDRIETIISFEAAARLGIKAEGSSDASTAAVLAEITDLVAAGTIEVPIAATYPLEEVRAAYAELEKRHTAGKIVLTP
jgi:NADPH2:quinone reductase